MLAKHSGYAIWQKWERKLYTFLEKWLVWQLDGVTTRDVGNQTWHCSLRETTDVLNSSPGLLRHNRCQVEPNLVQCVITQTNRCARKRQTKRRKIVEFLCYLDFSQKKNCKCGSGIPQDIILTCLQ